MAEENSNIEAGAKKGFNLKNLGTGAWAAICVVALVAGLLIGRFAMGGGGAGAALNKTSLTEGELDTVVATYTNNGTQNSVTARQVIEMTSSLESAKDDEGNYNVPSADNVLYSVRNSIAIAEAKNRGIEATDEQLLDYAEKTLGQTPDFESIATTNNLDVDTVKKLLTDSYLIHELQAQIAGESTATEPTYPTEPEYATTNDAGEDLSDEEIEANRNAAYKNPNADYAKYIIELAGDEWDAKKGTWKSEDGEYATALKDYEIKKDSATYEAAYAAYQVAYSAYSTQQNEQYEKVSDFLGDLYANSSINILTLIQQ
ncbi:MAG: hypothetical protein J6S63_05625 [Atopobiaceae bacterium]|nr:hypothetical protein [Atopobiaceae bacterium]